MCGKEKDDGRVRRWEKAKKKRDAKRTEERRMKRGKKEV